MEQVSVNLLNRDDQCALILHLLKSGVSLTHASLSQRYKIASPTKRMSELRDPRNAHKWPDGKHIRSGFVPGTKFKCFRFDPLYTNQKWAHVS